MKNSFKFYLDKFGIRLELSEINEICEIFDKNKNGHINFVEFLNSLRLTLINLDCWFSSFGISAKSEVFLDNI